MLWKLSSTTERFSEWVERAVFVFTDAPMSVVRAAAAIGGTDGSLGRNAWGAWRGSIRWCCDVLSGVASHC